MNDFDFNKSTYKEFLSYLISLSEDKYKTFSASLTPDIGVVYGVRLPILKKIAKEISKSTDETGFKSLLLQGKSHEEKIIYSFLIGFLKYETYESFIYDIEVFLPKVNNWSVNDTLASSIRTNVKKYKSQYYEYLKELLTSNNPWKIRFALINLKCSYMDEKYIDDILFFASEIESDHYYVNMGISWLLCECFIKFRNKTFPLLLDMKLNKFVQNKSIQKIIESHRVDLMDKQLLKNYKI